MPVKVGSEGSEIVRLLNASSLPLKVTGVFVGVGVGVAVGVEVGVGVGVGVNVGV